jgi:type I restriction enzyme S subunit
MTAGLKAGGECLLQELLLTTKDGDWGRSDPTEGHLPYRIIRGADFARVRVGDIESVPLRYLSTRTAERRTLEPNDILIETAGGTSDRPTGRTLLVSRRMLEQFDGPVSCASFARFLRVNPELAHPPYVYWYLQNLYALGEMRQHEVRHTGVGRFQYTTFAATEWVPLPPRPVQQDIATTLTALDDKIVSNRRLIDLLETLGSVHLESAIDSEPFTSRVGDYLSVLETGKRPRGGAVPEGVVSLGAENVRSAGVVPSSDFKRIPVDFALEMNRGHLVDGDVLVYKDGAALTTEGASLVSAFGYGFPVDQATINEHVYRLRAREGVSQALLYWMLRSTAVTREIRKNVTGAAQPGLNSTNLKSVAAPDIGSDNVADLNNILEPFFERILTLGAESMALARLRNALMPELLSGTLQVLGASGNREESGT